MFVRTNVHHIVQIWFSPSYFVQYCLFAFWCFAIHVPTSNAFVFGCRNETPEPDASKLIDFVDVFLYLFPRQEHTSEKIQRVLSINNWEAFPHFLSPVNDVSQPTRVWAQSCGFFQI